MPYYNELHMHGIMFPPHKSGKHLLLLIPVWISFKLFLSHILMSKIKAETSMAFIREYFQLQYTTCKHDGTQ